MDPQRKKHIIVGVAVLAIAASAWLALRSDPRRSDLPEDAIKAAAEIVKEQGGGEQPRDANGVPADASGAPAERTRSFSK